MPTSMKRIRVLVADDHALIRAGIIALLESLERVEVVGQAEDGGQALDLIEKLSPDVVLLDLQMPGKSGFEVLRETTARFPAVKIVALSVHDSQEYAVRAVESGAAGFLPKSAAGGELELAIDQVVRGEQYLSPFITSQSDDFATSRGANDIDAKAITPRQREVLVLVAEGFSTKDIAITLRISVKTVETHRAQLMDRLGIHDVARLVRYAIRTGIVKLEG